MPTPPWYGHLLRGITEMSRKLCDRLRRKQRSQERCPACSVQVACQIDRSIAQSIQRFIFLGSEEAPAKRVNLLCWEKSTCSMNRLRSNLIAHSRQSGAEKCLEAFAHSLVLSHCGSNCFLRQRTLIAQIDEG